MFYAEADVGRVQDEKIRTDSKWLICDTIYLGLLREKETQLNEHN